MKKKTKKSFNDFKKVTLKSKLKKQVKGGFIGIIDDVLG